MYEPASSQILKVLLTLRVHQQSINLKKKGARTKRKKYCVGKNLKFKYLTYLTFIM